MLVALRKLWHHNHVIWADGIRLRIIIESLQIIIGIKFCTVIIFRYYEDPVWPISKNPRWHSNSVEWYRNESPRERNAKWHEVCSNPSSPTESSHQSKCKTRNYCDRVYKKNSPYNEANYIVREEQIKMYKIVLLVWSLLYVI